MHALASLRPIPILVVSALGFLIGAVWYSPLLYVKGAGLGLFAGMGLVAAREGTNAVFEKRTLRHYMIFAGHDVVLLAVQGAILAVWR